MYNHRRVSVSLIVCICHQYYFFALRTHFMFLTLHYAVRKFPTFLVINL